MKNIFIIAALAFTTLGFAQRKELKKIEKAIADKDFKEAIDEFNQINESEVESKYLADYTFYKAAITMGNPARPIATEQELRQIIEMLKEAGELGFNDEEQIIYYQQTAADAILSGAQKKLASGDQNGALDDVIYLLELSPDNSSLRENAANLAYRTGDFELAKANYEMLLEQGYTGVEETVVATNVKTGEVSAFPNKQTAEFAVLSGEFKDIVKEESESQLGAIVSNLAWTYKNNGQLDKANALVIDMLNKYPEDASLKTVTPDLYLMLGKNDDYERAIKELKTEIKDPRVFENLGIGAAEKGNWDQAIDYYDKSLELAPDNYAAQNNIAVACLNKANLDKTNAEDRKMFYTKAMQHLEKVLELKPDLASAKQTLLGLYKFLGMEDKAAALEAKM